MRARRINYLRRVVAVQDFYQEIKNEGTTEIFVWRKHVYPRWLISYATFRRYMELPAKRDLNQIQNDEK